jgi:hypothetical protein
MPIDELGCSCGFSDAWDRLQAGFRGQCQRERVSENSQFKRLLIDAQLEMHALKSVLGGTC